MSRALNKNLGDKKENTFTEQSRMEREAAEDRWLGLAKNQSIDGLPVIIETTGDPGSGLPDIEPLPDNSHSDQD